MFGIATLISCDLLSDENNKNFNTFDVMLILNNLIV